MKKTLVLTLALALIAVGVWAEAAFRLENGATWGMTQGDVMALEAGSELEYGDLDGMQVLEVDDTAFRGHEADASFLFSGDALAMATYEMDAEDVDPMALIAALDGEYGEHEEDQGLAYYDFISELTGTLYYVQPQTAGIGVRWTLPDGTVAALMVGPNGDADDVAVVYWNAAGSGALGGTSLSEPAPALEP